NNNSLLETAVRYLINDKHKKMPVLFSTGIFLRAQNRLVFSALFQNRNSRQYFSFHEFKESTAAGRNVRDFVSQVPFVDCCQSIDAASNREGFALGNSVRYGFGTLCEYIKFKYTAWTIPQYRFGIFDNVSNARCRFRTIVNNFFVGLDFAWLFHR